MDDYRNHYEALEMSSQESDTCGQGECGPVRKMRHIASGRIDVIKTIPADPMNRNLNWYWSGFRWCGDPAIVICTG